MGTGLEEENVSGIRSGVIMDMATRADPSLTMQAEMQMGVFTELKEAR
jgi:hypothetical protein